MAARVYLVFRSTHDTLRAEGVLQAAGVACRVVTKPAGLPTDCGLAVRLAPEAMAAAKDALGGARMAPQGEFTRDK